MATLTVALSQEFLEAKERFPKLNWNNVVKHGILRRLGELERFEKMRREVG
ncbi:MAG: hypothetical protein V1875_06980 [Candidatus Altiarchaeota archaeon]